MGMWYREHLGVDVQPAWGGAVFSWSENDPMGTAATVWSPFSRDTEYFLPSPKDFMVNFRVSDLEAMLHQLRRNGSAVDDRVEEREQGRFGWVMDPEGNRVELWEPVEFGVKA